jgi:2-methylcitrate dehydratase PrpD
MSQHDLNSEQVTAVRIETFKYAVELGGQNPKTLDEMTYGIVFPVAIMIARGRIGVEELQAAILEDPEICRISNATELLEDPAITQKSIEKRWARLTLLLSDGRELTSDLMSAKGDPDDPLSDTELAEKYHLFTDPVLGVSRAESVKEMAQRFDTLSNDDLSDFFDLILEA